MTTIYLDRLRSTGHNRRLWCPNEWRAKTEPFLAFGRKIGPLHCTSSCCKDRSNLNGHGCALNQHHHLTLGYCLRSENKTKCDANRVQIYAVFVEQTNHQILAQSHQYHRYNWAHTGLNNHIIKWGTAGGVKCRFFVWYRVSIVANVFEVTTFNFENERASNSPRWKHWSKQCWYVPQPRHNKTAENTINPIKLMRSLATCLLTGGQGSTHFTYTTYEQKNSRI